MRRYACRGGGHNENRPRTSHCTANWTDGGGRFGSDDADCGPIGPSTIVRAGVDRSGPGLGCWTGRRGEGDGRKVRREHVGRSSVDIYAPGRNVIACVPLYLSLLELQASVRFYGKTPLSGTSMAAPIMSATLAVYLIRRAGNSDSLVEIVTAFRKAAVPCVNQEMGLSIGTWFPKR